MENKLFKKLNLKDQDPIVILNAPGSFGQQLLAIEEEVKVITELNSILEKITFALVFATKQDEVDEFATILAEKLEGDAVIWFSYPKKSSKNYICEFDRDTGWDVMGKQGLEPVRQVAIDDDWSALRFRKVEFIKNFTRRESYALTKEGKKRTTNKTKK